MKKAYLIQKTKERFSNLPQDVAVVVNCYGKKHAITPAMFDMPRQMENFTINQIKPFFYGEIVEEQQELCGNPEYQFLTFRAEAPIDIWSFAYYCSMNFEEIMFDSVKASNSIYQSHRGKLAAPSNLSLTEVKSLMWDIADKYNLGDVHVLIQSLDYPVFEGLRDRDTPQPNQK